MGRFPEYLKHSPEILSRTERDNEQQRDRDNDKLTDTITSNDDEKCLLSKYWSHSSTPYEYQEAHVIFWRDGQSSKP